jgi:hypothetical protein
MANNRIHVVCEVCKAAGEAKDALLIAKYYPNTGWYRKLDGMDELLDKFFETHEHPEHHGMWGTYISIQREVDE